MFVCYFTSAADISTKIETHTRTHSWACTEFAKLARYYNSNWADICESAVLNAYRLEFALPTHFDVSNHSKMQIRKHRCTFFVDFFIADKPENCLFTIFFSDIEDGDFDMKKKRFFSSNFFFCHFRPEEAEFSEILS